LDQLLLILKTLFTFFYKTSYPNEVNRSEPSPSVSVPWFNLLGVDDEERDAQDDGPELVDGVAEFSGRR
jgi:hypothetical protein